MFLIPKILLGLKTDQKIAQSITNDENKHWEVEEGACNTKYVVRWRALILSVNNNRGRDEMEILYGSVGDW